jgi:hypothetical protein
MRLSASCSCETRQPPLGYAMSCYSGPSLSWNALACQAARLQSLPTTARGLAFGSERARGHEVWFFSRPRKALADIVIGLQEIRGTRELWLPNLDDQTRVQLSHLRTLDRVPCSGKVTTGSVD